MENGMQIKPNIVVDMTGHVCPPPLLGAKRVVEDMSTGEILLLKSDCPGTRDDLFSWTKATGDEVVRSEKLPDGVTEYYLRKGIKAAIVPHVTLDMTGLICPGPIIEAKQIIDTMESRKIMKLVSTCSSTKDDVETWCTATGNVLLSTQETEPGVWAFFIRKG